MRMPRSTRSAAISVARSALAPVKGSDPPWLVGDNGPVGGGGGEPYPEMPPALTVVVVDPVV
jgi:hypothetical protein